MEGAGGVGRLVAHRGLQTRWSAENSDIDEAQSSITSTIGMVLAYVLPHAIRVQFGLALGCTRATPSVANTSVMCRDLSPASGGQYSGE